MNPRVRSQFKTIVPALRRMIGAVLFLMGTGLVHAQNLVTNGGFESGMTGWTNARSGSGSASFSLESSLSYAGANALKTVVSNPGADNWNVETRAPIFSGLGTGKALSVTFRARAATPGTNINAAFQNGAGTYRAQSFTLSTSWAFYTWNHTTIQDSPGLRFQYRSAGTVWLDQISVVVNPTTPAGLAVTPNLAMRHQIMDGIGGSIAFNLPDYEALSATQKNQIENLLYVDCGIDLVRLRTGNSDALNNELAMRAQRNGARSLLTCWSPPASLKSNNSIISGTLRIVSGKYDYAGFADWWHARLNASDWIHDFISIQNEPSYDPGNKETCRFLANETVPATANGSASYRLALDAVHNRIRNEPKKPQVIAVDAETHSAFNSIAPTVSGLSFVNHLGFHNYGSNDFAGVASRYHGRRGWMTEWGKDASATDPVGIRENWLLLPVNIHETLVGANASAYLAWRMVHGNNTGQVWAMIGVENRQFQVQNSFYSVKHFAKEISAGDQRFEVTRSDTNADVRISGYINRTGRKLTLVALNTSTAAAGISLRLPGIPVHSMNAFQTKQADMANNVLTNPYQALGTVDHAQTQTLPAQSITTYVISLSETLNPYDPALLRVDRTEHRGNQFSVTIPAQPGHDFILWRSSILTGGSWQEVTNAVVTESDGQLTLTDPTPVSGKAYYRVGHDKGP
jgi:glucuronoarabinoxylan endo-1,4-beta-xylanase